MEKVDKSRFADYTELIDPSLCGAVYPRSVTLGIQDGDIYEDGGAALIWHYCGFGTVAGSPGEHLYDEIYRLMTGAGNRRLVLFTNDAAAVERFRALPGIVTGLRYFFGYGHGAQAEPAVPEGFSAAEIDAANIGKLSGRIVPSFSWSSGGAFLERGKGFCVTRGGEPVSWAFSAATDGRETDIGVETAENYRGMGLAAAAAGLMARYALTHGTEPVWACGSGNTASRRTAERAGFVKCGECFTISVR